MADFQWFGAPDSDGIASWHKIWIIQFFDPLHPDAGGIGVTGYLGEGTSREIVSNWDAPFADSSLESKFRVAGGLAQLGAGGKIDAGMTSLTKLNSRQVWTGNQPYTFNLTMKFRAFTDASKEVETAIEALEVMMAPNLIDGKLTAWFGIGMPSFNSRVPLPVLINFGRKQLLSGCCIRSMSTPFDKEKDASGNMIRADVSLQVETLESVTKTDLAASTQSSEIDSAIKSYSSATSS